jgi:hypothetical protein
LAQSAHVLIVVREEIGERIQKQAAARVPPSGKKACADETSSLTCYASFVILPDRAGSRPTGLPSTIMVPRLSFGMRDTRKVG